MGIFEDNLKLNAEELAAGKTVLRSRPLSLAFTATTSCNLSCIMCSRGKTNRSLSPACADKLAELFPYLQHMNIQGGEPLIAPWLDSFIEKAAAHPHMDKFITTNGLLIDRLRADLFARAGVALLWSIDSPRPAVYEHIRRGARYEQLRAALEAVKAANAGRQKQQRRELNVVVMRSNADHLEEFLPFALEYGFCAINLVPILFNDSSPEDIFANGTPQEVRAIGRRIAALCAAAAKAGVRIQNSVPAAPPETQQPLPPAPEQALPQERAQQTASVQQAQGFRLTLPPGFVHNPFETRAPGEPVLCHMPWRQLFVDFSREDGPQPQNVFPECFCWHPIGNIETDTLEQIWNGPVMQEYRQRLFSGNLSGFCRKVCLQRLPRGRFT